MFISLSSSDYPSKEAFEQAVQGYLEQGYRVTSGNYQVEGAIWWVMLVKTGATAATDQVLIAE